MSTAGAIGFETYRLGKRFGDFTALYEVTLAVRPATVHALLGENGAGKSTLVKCLAGYHRADAGALLVDQREQDIRSPADARALGIGMVYQHFTSVLLPAPFSPSSACTVAGRTASVTSSSAVKSPKRLPRR